MNKTTQDLAWSVLPKEFKEEVKVRYKMAIEVNNSTYAGALGFAFGEHNLTSDTEGEDELLTVPRSKVAELYRKFKKDGSDACLYAAATLDSLFGDKCLPDAHEDYLAPYNPIPPISGELKTQTAETQTSPKYKTGDKVKIIGGYYGFIGHIGEVIGTDGNDINVKLPGFGISTYDAKDLAPYADDDIMPPTFTDNRKSQSKSQDQFRDPTKMIDDIITHGFADHNRLNIAAMAMAGLLANEGVTCFTDVQELEHMDFITYHALEYADKLIKKSKEDEEQ